MKVAFVNTNLITCGGIITNFEYCKKLRELGIDAVMMAEESNPMLEKHYDIKREPIDMTGVDVVIANRWEQIDGLKAQIQIQFVQGRDLEANVGDDWKERLKVARSSLQWALVGVSEYCLRDWGRGIVIPNGAGEQFKPSTYLKEKWDIMVEGNDEPNKNIPEAIEIAKRYSDNIIWVGRNASDRYGIEFKTCTQREMPKMYQQSKILLKMSKSEGFSLPILEAMACGCTVATVDMGGNDFCRWGENCIYPEQIPMYLNDDKKREEIANAGIETASQYTWENSTNKLLEFILNFPKH